MNFYLSGIVAVYKKEKDKKSKKARKLRRLIRNEGTSIKEIKNES